MQFHSREAIYLQIVDYVGEKILKKEWQPGDRIPAVRGMADELGVNPNTVVRAYVNLGKHDIIYKRRGIGYFISTEACEKSLDLIKNDFLKQKVPEFLKKMQLLGIDFDEIKPRGTVPKIPKRGLSPNLTSSDVSLDKSMSWD
jgi:DNA-binding transcriptional regulator YhcF (GntR family)